MLHSSPSHWRPSSAIFSSPRKGFSNITCPTSMCRGNVVDRRRLSRRPSPFMSGKQTERLSDTLTQCGIHRDGKAASDRWRMLSRTGPVLARAPHIHTTEYAWRATETDKSHCDRPGHRERDEAGGTIATIVNTVLNSKSLHWRVTPSSL